MEKKNWKDGDLLTTLKMMKKKTCHVLGQL
jgi:hypothetical protein